MQAFLKVCTYKGWHLQIAECFPQIFLFIGLYHTDWTADSALHSPEEEIHRTIIYSKIAAAFTELQQ